jgi:glycine betaine/proline transport system substrate-binding protein
MSFCVKSVCLPIRLLCQLVVSTLRRRILSGIARLASLKNCATLFSSGKDGDSGLYIAGLWGKPEVARIRALELNFRVDSVAKAEYLWAAL